MGRRVRPHVREAFEFAGVSGSDAQQARTESNRRQRARVDVFVDLFAADDPVLRQLRHCYIWLCMRFEIFQTHAAFFLPQHFLI